MPRRAPSARGRPIHHVGLARLVWIVGNPLGDLDRLAINLALAARIGAREIVGGPLDLAVDGDTPRRRKVFAPRAFGAERGSGILPG